MEPMHNLLDILIPTLNRDQELIANLMRINKYIMRNHYENCLNIIISDNGSEEESFNNLRCYLENEFSFKYKLYRQKCNIGIEKNILFLLEQSDAKYVMTLGDDDYFTEDYLRTVICYLKKGTIRGIIPNYYPVDSSGARIGNYYRDPVKADKVYDRRSLWISEKGHQLSCIVFEREGVLEAYLANVKPNVYPFIFFIAFNLAAGEMVHVTCNPFANTVLKKKNWDYSKDNLMGQLAIVFDALPYQNYFDKNRQLFKMIRDNARRYCCGRTFLEIDKVFQMIDSYNISKTVKYHLKIRFLLFVLESPARKLKESLIRNLRT